MYTPAVMICRPIYPDAPPANVIKLLESARNSIEIYGWCQHLGVDQHNRRCMIGALEIEFRALYPSYHVPATKETYAVYVHARDCLAHVVGCEVTTWNDRPERTLDQVFMAFNLAIRMETTRLHQQQDAEMAQIRDHRREKNHVATLQDTVPVVA